MINSDVAVVVHDGEIVSYYALMSFEHALVAMRRQTLSLVSAIGTLDFLLAWCECRELQRVLAYAEACVNAIPIASDRDNSIHRMHAVRSLALPLLELAPMPSKGALKQARSSNWKTDREQWKHEEQQWIAAREAGQLATDRSADRAAACQVR